MGKTHLDNSIKMFAMGKTWAKHIKTTALNSLPYGECAVELTNRNQMIISLRELFQGILMLNFMLLQRNYTKVTIDKKNCRLLSPSSVESNFNVSTGPKSHVHSHTS